MPNTSQLDLDILIAWVVEELLWDAAEWASILTSTQCNKPDAASGTRAPKRRLYDEDSESSGMDGLIEELVATRTAVRDLAVRANDFRFVVRGGEWCMAVHGFPTTPFVERRFQAWQPLSARTMVWPGALPSRWGFMGWSIAPS